MPLSAGDKLGHYEILVLIGKGGMGEVYRARDTKLKRDVALKVLPEAFASDPERMARFQREAEVLASLNHPNIAQIYGVEECALAMELVEGEAPKGPLPFEEAWKIASQIAAALEYAHERGIMHRDLKPANILVTSDGVVKLLDFGLAKAFSNQREPSASQENSPTLTLGATEMGVILGTAAYMAPEQARGKAVDKRADIWGFGVVLYEMLTGKRLFQGEDLTETLASVVKDKPDLSGAPAQVRGLLERCLEKDPKKRLRDIGDAMALVATPVAVDAAQIGPPPKASALVWLWALAGLLGLAAAGVSFLHFRETPQQMPVVTSSLLLPEDADPGLTDSFSMLPTLPAISPDGTRIVLGAESSSGKNELWLRRLDSEAAQVLPGTDGATLPFWSPDNRWVGFGQDGKLKKIDTQGGAPEVIGELNAGSFRGGSWSAQGTILFYSGGDGSDAGVYAVSADGGKAVPVSVLGIGARAPWFLPDGRHFLYTTTERTRDTIFAGSLDEPHKPGKPVAQAESTAVYAQGYLLYLREDTLMAQPFQANRLETTGPAQPIADGIPAYSPTRFPALTVSQTGILVYRQMAKATKSRLLWKNRQGKVLGDLGEVTDEIEGVALSPDGRRIAVSILGRDGNEDIWIYNVANGIRSRFTFDVKRDTSPVWSSDGRTLYFAANRKAASKDATLGVYRKASNGTGVEELLFESSMDANSKTNGQFSVSTDGKYLLAGSRYPNHLLALPLGQSQAIARRLLTRYDADLQGQFSPDGKWFAYAANGDQSSFQIYAASFPDGSGTRQISQGFGVLPRWRRDGKEIFYVALNGQLMAAEVSAGIGTLEAGKVTKLFGGIITTRHIAYDVTSDGQRFVVVDDGGSATRPFTLVQNWVAGLKK